MKKLALAIALMTASVSIYANGAAINLGEGNIGSPKGPYPEMASLSLDGLKKDVTYDITCKINDPDGAAYPVIAKFSLKGSFPYVSACLDGQFLGTGQGKISDNNTHILSFRGETLGKAVELTWIDGDGIADPLHYQCSAVPSVGSHKSK